MNFRKQLDSFSTACQVANQPVILVCLVPNWPNYKVAVRGCKTENCEFFFINRGYLIKKSTVLLVITTLVVWQFVKVQNVVLLIIILIKEP